MKAMLTGFVAAALIATAAYFALESLDYTSAVRSASNQTVRLGDAGPEEQDGPAEDE